MFKKCETKCFHSKQQSGQGLFRTLLNAIPPTNDTARNGFNGEKHQILKLQPQGVGVANYSGPGTHVKERLRRNDPPRTIVDMIAKSHDIDYSLAKNHKDTRKADKKMVKSLRKAQKKELDEPVNIQIAMKAIQAKMLGEDVGLIPKSLFINPKETHNTEADIKLLEKHRKKLEQQGYGLNPRNGKMELLPGMELKNELLSTLTKPKKRMKAKKPKSQHTKMSKADLLHKIKNKQLGKGFWTDVKNKALEAGHFIGKNVSVQSLIPIALALL